MPIQPDYQPTFIDEIRSIQRYLSWEFPDKDIARSRDGDMDYVDILITTVDGQVDAHNRSASFIDTPFVIYYNPTDFDDAVKARDKFVSLFELGKPVGTDWRGYKQRVPIWQWPDSGTPPPAQEAVMGWLKIRDVSSRVVEQDAPGTYIVVCEFISQSYRVTYDGSGDPTLTTIAWPPTSEVQP